MLAAVVLLLAATTASAQSWSERRASAVRYLQTRSGVESFAFMDDRGRLYSYRAWVRAPSASLLKAMLLVAYLDRPSVESRPLRPPDRALLGPMIQRSDNAAAGRVLGIVGPARLRALAHRARMRRFTPVTGIWGLSRIDAADQARYFLDIDEYVTQRHRAYPMHLLNSITPTQRWGSRA